MKTCLVVDDSEVVRKVARRILENLKLEISEAESGQQALDQCQQAMPDAIIFDYHMPGMGTVEFLSTLRGLTHGKKPSRRLLHDRERYGRHHAHHRGRAPTTT